MPIGSDTPLIEAALDEAVLSIESALNSARPRPHWHHGVERIRRKVLSWKELREEKGSTSQPAGTHSEGQAQHEAGSKLPDLPEQAGGRGQR